jgi:hypothetical protein
VNESFALQLAQRAVETARVGALEAERAQPVEQLVAVRRLLAQEQKQAGAQEVLGQRG